MGNIRELSLVYTYIPVGVYYWTSDNELYTPTAWSSVNTTIQSKKIGIIVSDESHAVCVTKVYSNSKENSTSGLPYELSNASDADCLTVYSESEAQLSFDGYTLSKPIYDTMGYIQGSFSDKLYVASLGETQLIINQDSVREVLGLNIYEVNTLSSCTKQYNDFYVFSSNFALVNTDSDTPRCEWWYLGVNNAYESGGNPTQQISSNPYSHCFKESSTSAISGTAFGDNYVFLVCYKIP